MNRLSFRAVAIVLYVVALGYSDSGTALGVTLAVTPQQLTFDSVSVGSTSAAQTVNVSSDTPTTVTVVQVSSWLSVSPSSSNISDTPTAFSVRVNAQNLDQGTYQGSFTVALSGSPTPNQVTINVQATVTGQSLLSANPSSLSFTAQAGSSVASPSSTTVVISSSAQTLNYTLSANVAWLGLTLNGGTTGGPGFSVSANPAGLSPGNYNGTITVQSTTTNDTVQIAVSLAVNANATLTVTPSMPAPFLYQQGGSLPAVKFLNIASSGGQVAFNVSQSPSTSWLVVTPLSGSAGAAPATLTLSVSPLGLSRGVYTTNLIVTPVNGSPLAPVPVMLVVSANPLLQLSNTMLTFAAPFGGAAPSDQSVNVTAVGTGGPVGFNFSSSNSWLSASASSGTAPSSLMVHADPSGLTIGNHTAIITLTPTNGDQYSLTITATITITDVSELTAGPSVLRFSHQIGQSPPQAQNVRLDTVGQPTTFTVQSGTTNCGSNWITTNTSGNMTPAVLSVSVNVSGMQAGICSGSVTVSFDAGSTQSSITIPVTVDVSTNALLRVSVPQGFGVVTVQQGSDVANQTITLTSSDPNTEVNYTVSATSGNGQWLFAPGAGSTPRNVSIVFQTSGLAAGTYMGEIRIQSDTLPSAAFTFPIRLMVVPNITVAVTPNLLVFEQPEGGPLPTAQTVTLTPSADGATFTASITSISGGDWLALDRTSGSASGAISFSIKQNSLTRNSYQARVRLVFQQSSTQPVDLTVILNVVQSRTLSTSVDSLQFTYQSGGALPDSQTFMVTTTGTSADFSLGTVSSGWLSVSPMGGTTPKEITVSVDPGSLSSGTYSGSITVTAAGIAGSPRTITVTLIVTGPPPPSPITITNNASYVAGIIAPGEILTIKGTNLGPPTAASFSVTSVGTVASTLGGVRVLFDGIPGTPIYVSTTQINVTAPYEISGRLQTTIVVEYLGTKSAGITVRVGDVAPGIYTLDSTGQGQAAAINQNGTFNGPPGGNTTPAAAGSVIAIYAAGGGQTNPASITGAVTPTSRLFPLPRTVTATIGGLPAKVEFAGAAPGIVTGVIQLNLRPDANVHGVVSIEISIDGITSPGGPTVAIQ